MFNLLNFNILRAYIEHLQLAAFDVLRKDESFVR